MVNTKSQNFEQLLNAAKSETTIVQQNLHKAKLSLSQKDSQISDLDRQIAQLTS
jgi:hypothetical protein